MKRRFEFMVNDTFFSDDFFGEQPFLDFLRNEMHLTGTKEGCREGDCGACLVLVGKKNKDSVIEYKAVASCLMPLSAIENSHVITIEGLREEGLTPVMMAILEAHGSQCGFCTPGFVIGLTHFLLSNSELTKEKGKEAIDGNLCRCTGYGSIERAIDLLITQFPSMSKDYNERLAFLQKNKVMPNSINTFKAFNPKEINIAEEIKNDDGIIIGGGTDYYVRNTHPDFNANILSLKSSKKAIEITEENEMIHVGASVSIHDFFTSPIIQKHFPFLCEYETKFASSHIRDRATIGGNICNASPIGDISNILLVLDPNVVIHNSKTTRKVKLDKFFIAYKKLDLNLGEYVEYFEFSKPENKMYFHFEKVAKRKMLDIASVNTAISFTYKNNKLSTIKISSGGVNEKPALLPLTMQCLEGKEFSYDLLEIALRETEKDIKPISDIRGSALYRTLLLKRLIKAHFICLFPEIKTGEKL